jgi:hypothetical protein
MQAVILGAVESTKVTRETRSGCPINLTLEILGTVGA